MIGSLEVGFVDDCLYAPSDSQAKSHSKSHPPRLLARGQGLQYIHCSHRPGRLYLHRSADQLVFLRADHLTLGLLSGRTVQGPRH